MCCAFLLLLTLGPRVFGAFWWIFQSTRWALAFNNWPGAYWIWPILGIVENMSMHICSNCGHAEPIFGEGGGAKMCADYGVQLLGQLPLDLSIRQNADAGKPTVVAEPDGKIAEIYKSIARKAAAKIAEKAQDFSHRFPKIVIQK